MDLKECLKNSYNYESRAGHDAENLSTELIGMVQEGIKIYEVYRDTAGNYWHKTKFMKDGRIISEYEHIFGRPEKKKRNTGRYLNEEYYERGRDRRGADLGECKDNENENQGSEGAGDREVV